MSIPSSTFPGGTSVSFLDVYDDVAPDGLRGGSPHMHLVSTEGYVVVGGEGELHTLSASGAQQTPLREGSVVWFTPGTIHRAVNRRDLRVIVLMSNAGLPEAGDAVMTFPESIVADPARYRAAAALPARESIADRTTDAAHRRDLAVQGFLALRAAVEAGDLDALHRFHLAAAAIVKERAPEWIDLVERGPLAQAEESARAARRVAEGRAEHLLWSTLQSSPALEGEPRFGMCGRLRPVDLAERVLVF